jgi:TfoX-like protein
MAFDEKLAGRIRKHLGKRKGLTEKQMFGGIAFLLNGNMCCGVHRDEMIVRLAPDETERALEAPHTHLFDLTGRPMKGWILVKPKGLATDTVLAKWIRVAAQFAGSLPPK